MKLIFLFFFVSYFFVGFLSTASPAQEVESVDHLLHDKLAVAGSAVLSRSKRATCPWFPGACVIHCRSKGFSTGFCRGGTCTCKNN